MPAGRLHGLRSAFAAELEAFESVTGLRACVYDLAHGYELDGVPVLPEGARQHTSAFCRARKSEDLRACLHSDRETLPGELERRGGVFVQRCHAGACEVVAPVRDGERLAGILCLGQFRRSGRAGRGDAAALERRTPSEVRRDLRLAAILAGRLSELLQQVDRLRLREASDRARRIERFFVDRAVSAPTLADLAEHLSLSPSRTAHVVREETGRSFRELFDAARLERARDLLTRPGLPVAAVARRCGFGDPAYFSRFFRCQTGETPTAYRRRRLDAPGPV